MGRNKKEPEKDRGKEPQVRRDKPTLNLSDETKRGIAVVLFVVLSIISFLSVLNLAGNLGDFILKIYKWIGGLLGYFSPLLFFVVAVMLAKEKLPEGKDHSFYWRTYLGIFLFSGSVAGLLHVFYMQSGGAALDLAMSGRGGGYLGALFSLPANPGVLGFIGGSVLLFALLVISVLVLFNVSLDIFMPWRKKQEAVAVPAQAASKAVQINSMAQSGFTSDKLTTKNPKVQMPEEAKEEKKETPAAKPATQDITIKTAGPALDAHLESVTLEARKDWKLPPFDLLEDNKSEVEYL